jgi:hypothetical protein
VQKEFPVLGIEAHHIGRQHIDAEIRRKLRNVLAVGQPEPVSAIARHEVSTRTLRRHPEVRAHDTTAVIICAGVRAGFEGWSAALA